MTINITIEHKDFSPEIIEKIKKDVEEAIRQRHNFISLRKPFIVETWEDNTPRNGIKIILSGMYYK